MRIYEDHNGVRVNAISSRNGCDVEGHCYQVLAGSQQSEINFQLGPVKEAGVNGVTNEALLAIVIHRTKYLNTKFPCRENSLAITKIEEALHWLEARTKDRLSRDVEGTNVP